MQIKTMLSGIAFILLATLCGVLIAIWAFKHFKINIPLQNQAVDIELQEPLQARVKIHEALDVNVKGKVNASIPIHEQLDIPLS
ncbi:hypothetical protein ACY2EV_29735, partial [Klebsiella pneumoniae]